MNWKKKPKVTFISMKCITVFLFFKWCYKLILHRSTSLYQTNVGMKFDLLHQTMFDFNIFILFFPLLSFATAFCFFFFLQIGWQANEQQHYEQVINSVSPSIHSLRIIFNSLRYLSLYQTNKNKKKNLHFHWVTCFIVQKLCLLATHLCHHFDYYIDSMWWCVCVYVIPMKTVGCLFYALFLNLTPISYCQVFFF